MYLFKSNLEFFKVELSSDITAPLKSRSWTRFSKISIDKCNCSRFVFSRRLTISNTVVARCKSRLFEEEKAKNGFVKPTNQVEIV